MTKSSKRHVIWQHNAFIGWAVQMQKHASVMIKSETTTDRQRDLARAVLTVAMDLEEELRKGRA